MNDDLDQLLESLKMRQLKNILGRELARAEKEQPAYSDFLARVLREEYQAQQMRFLEYRIRRAQLPERWALETYLRLSNAYRDETPDSLQRRLV